MMTRMTVTFAALAGLLLPLGAIAAPMSQAPPNAPAVIAALQNQLVAQQAESPRCRLPRGRPPIIPG